MHWLDAPEAWPPDVSGLPDPLERCGRHVMYVVVQGVALSHGEWTRTHDGVCPPLCKPIPQAAPVNMQSFDATMAAWRLMFGTYKPRKPVDEWVKGQKVVPLKFDLEPYA